jgi:hypothetical protein
MIEFLILTVQLLEALKVTDLRALGGKLTRKLGNLHSCLGQGGLSYVSWGRLGDWRNHKSWSDQLCSMVLNERIIQMIFLIA